MAAPVGNQYGKGPKRQKVITWALERELSKQVESRAEQCTKAEAIVEKLVDMALGGDMAAIKEVVDRIEGKAVQSIESTVTVSEELLALMAAARQRAIGRNAALLEGEAVQDEQK